MALPRPSRVQRHHLPAERGRLAGRQRHARHEQPALVQRPTGGRELFVLEHDGPTSAMAKPARRLRIGEDLLLDGEPVFRITSKPVDGVLRLEAHVDVERLLTEHGNVPLPPYLGRTGEASDVERYQTVYAGPKGAAAAPTAGLHFTPEVLQALRSRGVDWATVTLHVGLGTFRPLREQDLHSSTLHRERYHVPEATVEAVRAARARGGRVIAVGTTTVRTLQAATLPGELPVSGHGDTRLFLRPPAQIHAVDGLITNFHLPKSSLLMLVACMWTGVPVEAYAEAQDKDIGSTPMATRCCHINSRPSWP